MVVKFTFSIIVQKYEEEKWTFIQNDARRKWANVGQGKRNG